MEKYRDIETKETLYKTYVSVQKDNLDKIALYTRYGEAITHRRLLNEIDKVAARLLLYKTESVSKIGILSLCSYEEAVFLLAANKIGAVTKYVDITKNVTEIGESIEESSIDILVMEDIFIPIEQYINPLALPVIVLGKTEVERPNYCSYQELLQKSDVCMCQAMEYRDNTCAVIICSSGTTGKPKPIELSDQAINTAVMKHIASDLPMATTNIMLKVIPSFIGMGLISTLYTGLITGNPILYPEVISNTQDGISAVLKVITGFPSFVGENHMHPDTKLLIFASPMFYRGLYFALEHIEDLSFVGCMLAGGSAMSREEMLDAAVAAKGCKVPILIGYGQNEMAGGVTMNEIGANKRGSAGKPMAYTSLKIVDMDTGEPLPNNTVGMIFERSDSIFLKYENMPKQTKTSFVTDKHGDIWFDTKDIGYIDEDGFLFFAGRTSRVIIRLDVKASLDKIEDKIRMSKYIKEVGAIALNSVPYDTPYAFVVLKNEYTHESITPEMIISDIQSSHNPLNDPEMVEELFIVKSLPYLSSGKIDYQTLRVEAEKRLSE